jgi:hypothetical protein
MERMGQILGGRRVRVLRGSGLVPRHAVYGATSLLFGVLAVFFLVKSLQFFTPSCLDPVECAFAIVSLVFGLAFGVAALVLGLLWARSRRRGVARPPW